MKDTAKLSTKFIKYSELKDFSEAVSKGEFKGIIPIDRSRAYKHSLNPNVRESDEALIIATNDNEECFGYIGLIPEVLSFENKNLKIFWLSTAKFSYHGRVSVPLFRAIKRNFKVIISTGNNELSSRTCRREGFFEYQFGLSRTFFRFLLNPFCYVSSIFERLKIAFRGLCWIFLFFEKVFFLFAKINDFALSKLISAFLKNKIIIDENKISDEVIDYLIQDNRYSFSVNKERVRWIVDNPWFPSSPKANGIESKYFFNKHPKSVKYRAIKILDEEKKIECSCMFSLIEDEDLKFIKVLEIKSSKSCNKKYLCLSIIKYFIDLGCQRIIFPNYSLSNILFDKILKLLSRINSHTYFVWSEDSDFLAKFPELTFSLWDGDVAHW